MNLEKMNQFLFILIFTILFVNAPIVCLAQVLEGSKDGKLLRSDPWQPFDVQSAKGDFFVSPTGNDNWSGTLPEANTTSTDGPFATIMRAKSAVRELKTKVYLPKGTAIDARY